MTILKILILSIVFVITSGSVFHKQFSENKKLRLLAAIVAVVSSFYLIKSIYVDIIMATDQKISILEESLNQDTTSTLSKLIPPIFIEGKLYKDSVLSFQTDFYLEENSSEIINFDSPMKELNNFIKTVQDNFVITNYQLHGYCSCNEIASENLTSEAERILIQERVDVVGKIVWNKIKDMDKKLGFTQATIEHIHTGECSKGFIKHLDNPNIRLDDKQLIKDMIMRHDNEDYKIAEIQNLQKVYLALKTVCAQSRNVRVHIDGKFIPKNLKNHIRTALTNPSKFKVEELIFISNNVETIDQKTSILNSALDLYPDNWKLLNNKACVLILDGEYKAAKKILLKADMLSDNIRIVENNLDIVERCLSR